VSGHLVTVDQGTTSTRCLVVDARARVVASAQAEHDQIMRRAGWVEHDPRQILDRTRRVVTEALDGAGLRPGDVAAVGITNQRETTVVWDRRTGDPIADALVWQDTRTAELCRQLAGDAGPGRYRRRTGLPVATYFSGPKIRWLLDAHGARDAAARGDLAFGTVDSWLVWHLTGGPDGGRHVTDVTNASRTLLADVTTLEWAADIADDVGVPTAMLPEIRPSLEVLGHVRGLPALEGVPIAAVLGDQQAATFGQACFDAGEAKNTYGTGNFLLLNTGPAPVFSDHGLITTPLWRTAAGDTAYALEGSIAVTGSLVQWLRDNLGLIDSAIEVEGLARTVDDNGGVYVVPAFSGLFAPHWRDDARGVIAGLTRYATRGHLARAALEATAYQTREVVDAMNADAAASGRPPLSELRVDGGMVGNELLMQFQADVLGVPVIRPAVTETTALGAALAAGVTVGVFDSFDAVRAVWAEDRRWQRAMPEDEVDGLLRHWGKAVDRTLGWID
jgi:glycerol kinase